MLVLLDHGAPKGLIKALAGHEVVTAFSRGWDRLQNGDLLREAEANGFELLLTTDGNLRYQQNLTSRRISIIVLSGTTKWSAVRDNLDAVRQALSNAAPGSYAEVRTEPLPRARRRPLR